MSMFMKIKKEDLKNKLTKEQFYITQNHGTEKPFSGKHLNHPVVENLHIDKFSISTKSKSSWASLVYGDGEYLGNLPVELKIGKNPLKVLVPR